MPFKIATETTIIECTNPICRATFSVIGYTYGDDECTRIDTARLVPLTGNTPYFCPVCGRNLGKE